MRLGISSPLAHKTPEGWARRQAGLGCRAVTFPVDSGAEEGLIDRYAQAAADNDLVIAEVGVWRNPISPDKTVRENALAYAKSQLALADRVGARCCVNISGSAGERWDGAYKENFLQGTYDATVVSIRDIIDSVRPKNTFYTIEPMPWMVPADPDDYLRLIKDVDRERFAVHMDFCNWVTSPRKYFFNEEFMDECFQKLGHLIKSCHLKDVNLGGELTFKLIETHCGGGSINLEKYAELALAADPDMPLIIEHLNSDAEYIESFEYVRKRLT